MTSYNCEARHYRDAVEEAERSVRCAVMFGSNGIIPKTYTK